MSSVVTDASSRPRSGRMLRLLSDERLVARVRAGDERAFEAVYDRYQAPLLSFCRHMLGDRDEAEDAVQHTCISAYRALLADDRPIQLKAWLFAIARNRCLSILRSRREHADVDDHAPSTAGLSVELERREDLRTLLADLHSLPEEQRAALVLMEIGAHSHDEIAVILDVRKDKVKALVFQAREHLQGRRAAREADCEEIREQLATLKGPSLRRTPLRHHLAVCAGCEEFAAEVRRQRAAFGVLLPVVPGAGLKASVLGSIFGGGGGAAGGGTIASGLGSGGDGAAAAAAGLGALGTGGGLFAVIGAQGATVKALATIVAAGGLGGAGYAAVDVAGGSDRPSSASVRSASAAPAAAAPARPVETLGPSGLAFTPTASTGRVAAPAARVVLAPAVLTGPRSLSLAFAPAADARGRGRGPGGDAERGADKAEKRAEKAEKRPEKAEKRAERARGKGEKRGKDAGRGGRRGGRGSGGGGGGPEPSRGPAAVAATAGPPAASSGGGRGGGNAKKSAPRSKGGGAQPRSAPATQASPGKDSGRRGGGAGGKGSGQGKGGDSPKSKSSKGSPEAGGNGGGQGNGGGNGKGGGRG